MKKKEDEEDSEELKREKEHNKKYGVEIKQTFPFPIFDSGYSDRNFFIFTQINVSQ